MSAIKVFRCGIIGEKLGMSSIFGRDGSILPVTLLKVTDNTVLRVRKRTDGAVAVLLGAGTSKNQTNPLRGIARKAGIDSFSFAREFVVCDSECSLQVGDKLSAGHLKEGQFVDVTAVSLGKGFAGAVKKYGFAGLEASHGVSLTHRSLGATGGRQDPGKVFKGKKMAGHMGCKRITVQSLKVVDVDAALSVVAILGAVPGGTKRNYVLIREARKKVAICSA